MRLPSFALYAGALGAAAMFAPLVVAQSASTPPAASGAASPRPESGSASTAPGLAAMAWLEGCWRGNVSQREFREVWLPQRGGMMLGVGQTVVGDATLDYEYLRLESRPDGVYYVASPRGKPEGAFRLTQELVDDKDGAHTFVFVDPARDFPQRIGYRRGAEGWLYTEVEGKVNGAERKLYYPMRRINCETGEIIGK